jgi:hypothetical protein
MATIQRGRSLTITVDSVNYSAQVAEVELVPAQTVDKFITLSDTTASVAPVQWDLRIRAFQDWGIVGSFCDALWTAAAAGTAISFDMGTDGSSFTGDVLPLYPSVGGAADAALEVEWTLPVTGDVTKV